MKKTGGILYSIDINKRKLILNTGDITLEPTDAIVNAANKLLTPGGGVCGAIHQAAGRELDKACKKLAPCETGDAVITKGFDLPSSYVIHTVGPVYSGIEGDKELLKSAYLSSLQLGEKHALNSIAFPSISTGIFGYPVADAASTALETIIDFLRIAENINEVRFILFTENDYLIYKKCLKIRIKIRER